MTALLPPSAARTGSTPLGAGPPARPPAQVATWLTCVAAMLVVAVATGLEPWAVGGAVALGAGAITSVATPIGNRFATFAGGLVAATVAGVLLIAILMGAMIGVPLRSIVIIPFVALFTVGLDWRRVDRLRPLVLLTGLAVVLAVAGGEAWTYGGGGIWLLLVLASLHLLETDRRAALAHVRPLVTGGSPPDHGGDLVATIATGVVVAVVLALLLTAPSCRNPFHDRNNKPPQGGAAPRGGSEGGRTGEGSDRGGGAARRYLPGVDGDFLVPGRSGRGSTDRIPGPDPATGWRKGSATERGTDRSARVYRRGADGSTRIRVTGADGTVVTYQYTPRSDGTSRVTEYDARGRALRTFTYDPNGRLTDGRGSTSERGRSENGSDPGSAKPKPKPKSEMPSLPGGRTLLFVLGAAALAAAMAWFVRWRRRRPPPPPGPPWAVALARRIGEEGRRRGRPRRSDETIVAYLDALAAGPLPDQRLVEIGRVLDAALFTATGVGETDRDRALSDWDATLADHPRRRRQPTTV